MATEASEFSNNDKDKNDKIKFDNVYGELEFFKKKCEVLEKDLFKSQTLNKKNESIIKKLQDMIAIYGKNTNNTSNSYLLPSEFKSNWESLIKDQVMEAFENCFFDYSLLTYLVQDTIKIIYEESLEVIKEKITNVLKALNIIDINEGIEKKNKIKEKEYACKDSNDNINSKEEISKIHKNNSGEFGHMEYDKFVCKFRLLFQEYFSIIFQSNNCEFQKKIKEKLNKLVKNDKIYGKFTEDKMKLIDDDLNSKSFDEFSLSAYKLCLYMHLHEPKLTFTLPSSDEGRKLIFNFYKKDEFTNIEGFPKDKCCCVVILPCPILRSNYPYQGIKPAVYIVSNPTQQILDECNNNNNVEKEIIREKEKEKNKSKDVEIEKEKDKDKHKEKEKDKENEIVREKNHNDKFLKNITSELNEENGNKLEVVKIENNLKITKISKKEYQNTSSMKKDVNQLLDRVEIIQEKLNIFVEKSQLNNDSSKNVYSEENKEYKAVNNKPPIIDKNEIISIKYEKEEISLKNNDVQETIKINQINKENNNISNLTYKNLDRIKQSSTDNLLDYQNNAIYSNYDSNNVPFSSNLTKSNTQNYKDNYKTNIINNNNIQTSSNLLGQNSSNNANIVNNIQKFTSHSKNHSHILSPAQARNLENLNDPLNKIENKEKQDIQKNNYLEHPLSITKSNLNESNLNTSKFNNINHFTNYSNYLDSNRTTTNNNSYLLANQTAAIPSSYINNNNNSANNLNTQYYSNPKQVNNYNNQGNNNCSNNNVNNINTNLSNTSEAIRILEMKNYRSNSHNFHLTHSRNPSAIDNLNNSFGKDMGKIRDNPINNKENSNLNSGSIGRKYLKNDFNKITDKNITHSNLDYSNSPISKNNENFNEKTINLIKPYLNNKLDREIIHTNASNKDNNPPEKDQSITGNRDYLLPYRQDFGKSLNSLNKNYSSGNTIGGYVRDEIKITSIQANMNQLGKLSSMKGNDKEKKDRTNLPLKQKSISEDKIDKEDSSNLNSHMFNRFSNNKNNNFINLEFMSLSRKKNQELDVDGKNAKNINLLDPRNIPHYDSCKRDDILGKSQLTSGEKNDTLTIQQNERKMNTKKKDSNLHINNYNTENYIENDIDSAYKFGNSPRALYTKQLSDQSNLNSKHKRYENLIQTPHSVINTDNSEIMIKGNNINKTPIAIEKNAMNIDFFSSATAKFFDHKDEENILKTNTSNNDSSSNQGCFMYIPKREPSNSQKNYDKPFFNQKYRETKNNSNVNSQLNTESNIMNVSHHNNYTSNNEINSSRIQSKNIPTSHNNLLKNRNSDSYLRDNSNNNKTDDIKYNGLKSGDFNSKLSNLSNNLTKNEKLNKENPHTHSREHLPVPYQNLSVNVRAGNTSNYNRNPSNNNEGVVKKNSNSSLLQNNNNENLRNSNLSSNKSRMEKNNTLNTNNKGNYSPINGSGNGFFNFNEKNLNNSNNNANSYGLTYKERMKNLKLNATNSLISNVNNNSLNNTNQNNTHSNNSNFLDNNSHMNNIPISNNINPNQNKLLANSNSNAPHISKKNK